jgi:L-cysteate sulfo-lyase
MHEQRISQSLTPSPLPKLDTPFAHSPRLPLANLPTPIDRAVRFSEALGGPEIFIKRDDLTGLATGGNKTRKLEFLLGDALSKGADTLITAGGPQSNHCRQTAAAAARAGLECHLVFGGTDDGPMIGNRFLDNLFGAKEHWTPKGTRESKMSDLAQELAAQGKKPYVIPVGGSNSIGALGYVAAMYELQWQIEKIGETFDHLVFATSSGGTQAGLVVGSKLIKLPIKLTSISIDQVPDGESSFNYKEFVLRIAEDIDHELKLGLALTIDDFPINYDYLGEGYGVVGDPEREAISLLAHTEGILVDPVYSGRALAGFMSLVRMSQFKSSDKVLFWHTGGETALHAYVNDLVDR